MIKKCICRLAAAVSLVFVGMPSVLSAVPGVDSFIKDISGEYVYYQDMSFKRESYVGILCYDESTYQIRYYAPKDEKEKLPEREISLLVSINPDVAYWEMTGERVVSVIFSDNGDVDILNYLHDLLYEFSARRIKIGTLSPFVHGYANPSDVRKAGFTSKEDFAQFGGSVTVQYDVIIPMFNIRTISDSTGKAIFDCCTIGFLQNSDDDSFSSFKGFPQTEKKSVQKINKYVKTRKYSTIDSQFVTLDENWAQPLENLWTLGDAAVVTVTSIPYAANDHGMYFYSTVRRMVESIGGSYVDLRRVSLEKSNDGRRYKIGFVSYQPENGRNIRVEKVIVENPNTNGYYYFSMSVFEDNYQQDKKYFDQIVKSYRVNVKK